MPLFGDPMAALSGSNLGGGGGLGPGPGTGLGFGGRPGPQTGLRPNARFASHPDLSMLNSGQQHIQQQSGLLGAASGAGSMLSQAGALGGGGGAAGYGHSTGSQVRSHSCSPDETACVPSVWLLRSVQGSDCASRHSVARTLNEPE